MQHQPRGATSPTSSQRNVHCGLRTGSRQTPTVIGTHWDSLALTGIHRHSPVLTGIRRHSSALAGTHRHSLALTGARRH
eukprot:11240991-Alexandrium_andersonii.AAC.1